jgi:hypothetical protein
MTPAEHARWLWRAAPLSLEEVAEFLHLNPLGMIWSITLSTMPRAVSLTPGQA